MARTTSSAVLNVLLKDYNTADAPSLAPFIDTASSIVDDLAEYAVSKSITVTNAKLELVERWLAAHCYVQSDPTYSSKSTGGASASFLGQAGMHLEDSRYGQMAMSLDKTGYLVALSGRKTTVTTSGGLQRVSGFWCGKPPSEQTPYDQRD